MNGVVLIPLDDSLANTFLILAVDVKTLCVYKLTGRSE